MKKLNKKNMRNFKEKYPLIYKWSKILLIIVAVFSIAIVINRSSQLQRMPKFPDKKVVWHYHIITPTETRTFQYSKRIRIRDNMYPMSYNSWYVPDPPYMLKIEKVLINE